MQTAYLMAELVMIPFAAFLASAVDALAVRVVGGSVHAGERAVRAGVEHRIDDPVPRGQGFVGGAMVPTVFATGFAMFHGRQRAMIPAILGMVSVLAPTLGPTLGGWITGSAGWRWLFYVNVVPGTIVTACWRCWSSASTAPNRRCCAGSDWVHLASMAVFLGGFEVVLEEGPKNGWFADTGIALAGWVSFVAFLLFLERSFRSDGPIVKLTRFAIPPSPSPACSTS
ncbi:MAG: MFS transporter [Sphingomonas sp.]